MFQHFFVFSVVEREENRQKKMITGIYEIKFFCPKWPFRDAYELSKKKFAETPIFIVFFGCALFGPSCQKRENLDTHPKKKKIFTDN